MLDATQRTMGQTVPVDIFKTFEISENQDLEDCHYCRRHGSVSPGRPRRRSKEHARVTSGQLEKSGCVADVKRQRVELVRSRLESPARRRNSSAESPGPSNVMSVVQRALQPALQPPMHPPLQSQLHSQLEMQSYSHLCLAQLCNLFETELRCLPSSQLGSQLQTRPRAHDRCLLT